MGLKLVTPGRALVERHYEEHVGKVRAAAVVKKLKKMAFGCCPNTGQAKGKVATYNRQPFVSLPLHSAVAYHFQARPTVVIGVAGLMHALCTGRVECSGCTYVFQRKYLGRTARRTSHPCSPRGQDNQPGMPPFRQRVSNYVAPCLACLF